MKKKMTPIAMRCNKKQFEAIKPKLEGMEIYSVTCFNEFPYLINYDNGIKLSNIDKYTFKNKIIHAEEIHETWNERIFLEACGIEIKETFEITKETIIKYKMKDEFPEVFKVKLEVGKWYKNDQNSIFFTCNVNNKKPYGYGITAGKVFVEDDNFAAWSVSGIKLATEQEVLEALKNEAVKRGFVDGSYIKLEDYEGFCRKNEDSKYFTKHNCFDFLGRTVFDNGKWATIIPTKTKEEAEKLLGVKIID